MRSRSRRRSRLRDAARAGAAGSRSAARRWRRHLTTSAAAVSVLASGQPLAGVLFAHARLRHRRRLRRDAAVGVVSAGAGRRGDPGRGLQRRLSRPRRARRRGRPPSARRSTCCSPPWKWCSSPTTSSAFLFAWELMTLATAALVATEHETRDEPARRVPVSGHVARRHRVPGRGFFTLVVGGRLAVVLGDPRGHVVSGPLRDGLFGLFFLGFGVKAGMIPLHVWLPEAHPAAPSSISALMSAVLITAGIYGLFRVCAFGLGTPRRELGPGVHGPRHAVGDSRRALRADAERPETAAGLQHD